MQIYTFHICVAEGKAEFIAQAHDNLAGAMQRAVLYAFEYGAHKTADEVQGHFICVFNLQNAEVFRTPLATYKTR